MIRLWVSGQMAAGPRWQIAACGMCQPLRKEVKEGAWPMYHKVQNYTGHGKQRHKIWEINSMEG